MLNAAVTTLILTTNDAAISVANSIPSSRLDYCNRLLCNTSERNLNKLQRIQNTLAHMLHIYTC